MDDSNQEEYISVSSFNHAKYKLDAEKDEQLFEKYGIKREEKEKNNLYYYYCTICGRSILIYDRKLEELDIRKLDSSIIVGKTDHYFKHYMENGDIVQIRFDVNNIQKMFFMNCKCGCEVGYYQLSNETNQGDLKRKEIAEVIEDYDPFYLLSDSITLDPKYSQVFVNLPDQI